MTVVAEQKRFVLSVSDSIRAQLENVIGKTPVILASGSPRRKEILGLAGINCKVVVPNVDEFFEEIESPEQVAVDLARLKLAATANAPGITVSADTIVVLGGHILGKPIDRADAKRILRILSGKKHYVVTSLALRNGATGNVITGFDKSFVTFNTLGDDEIDRYIESGEPMDKAGAYGIQGMGELLVNKLEGSLHNVVGFPIELFLQLARKVMA